MQKLQRKLKIILENFHFYQNQQKEISSCITYKKVRHNDLNDKHGKSLDLFLVLVKSEAYETPMAFLTNIEPQNSEEAWKIFFWYKKRWEVEKIYRDIKQKFKLESALIRNYKAWQTLVVLTAFAWEFMQELKQEVKEFLGVCYLFFKHWLKRKQQHKVTHLNLLDWIREFLDQYHPPFSQRIYSWKFFLHRFHKPQNQISLFDNRKKMVNL